MNRRERDEQKGEGGTGRREMNWKERDEQNGER
jgi:hypothetical protein